MIGPEDYAASAADAFARSLHNQDVAFWSEKWPRIGHGQDILFARSLHNTTVPHSSDQWPKINDLSRRGLLRVIPIHRWMAEVKAIGDAAP
jgi:hypothetical protein